MWGSVSWLLGFSAAGWVTHLHVMYTGEVIQWAYLGGAVFAPTVGQVVAAGYQAVLGVQCIQLVLYYRSWLLRAVYCGPCMDSLQARIVPYSLITV